MRKLSDKEEQFLRENPIVVATECRRFIGREKAEESLDAEKKTTKPFTAKYVREVCDRELGDMIIDYKATAEYKEKSAENKEFMNKKNEALKLGDKDLLRSLVDAAQGNSTTEPSKESKKTDEVDEELEAARAEYEEVVGKKAHHKMKLENIREAIEEHKSK